MKCQSSVVILNVLMNEEIKVLCFFINHFSVGCLYVVRLLQFCVFINHTAADKELNGDFYKI